MGVVKKTHLSCAGAVAVTSRLKNHVNDPDANPLLIFPEGTCVNNEYTVMFKKVRYTYEIRFSL